ncbi:MAG TPA: hypothetical protein VK866_01260 [Acidimicrobiales bacterium]|nr:hypothetical protein [Acidimicrobiales bacterium]
MRGATHRLHERLAAAGVRSDVALAAGLALAAVTVLVVIVAAVVAATRLV